MQQVSSLVLLQLERAPAAVEQRNGRQSRGGGCAAGSNTSMPLLWSVQELQIQLQLELGPGEGLCRKTLPGGVQQSPTFVCRTCEPAHAMQGIGLTAEVAVLPQLE
jgi:hypothetical protein